jgi:NAD(P)-dependent dehydrogenase (short-subunit alcohol dehydrogenase family)
METNFFGTLSVTQAMLPLLLEAPTPRIVNVSSGLGSLTMNGDPTWSFGGAKYLGYNTSKAALNMLTTQLAYEFRDTPMKVNSANPGYTATDMNGNQGHQTLEEGAAEPVRLALLPSDGPTGGFFETTGPHPWWAEKHGERHRRQQPSRRIASVAATTRTSSFNLCPPLFFLALCYSSALRRRVLPNTGRIDACPPSA